MVALLFYIIAFTTFFFISLNLLPVGTLPAGIALGFTTLAGYMKAWSFLLPISSLFSALVFVVVVDLAIFAWQIVKWVLGLLAGIRS